MTGFRLYAAWVQCGEAPPYQLTPIPVRMTDGYAEIQLDGQWMPCPGAGDKPKLIEHSDAASLAAGMRRNPDWTAKP